MNRNFALVVVLGVAGCATGPHVQRAQHLAVPIANSIDAEIRLTQHQMIVSHFHSMAGGAAGLQAAASPNVAAGGFGAGAAAGLIGALVDVAIDAHRNSVAEETAKPLREHMQGLNVDELVYQSLDGLDKQRFAQQINAQHLNQSEADDEKQNQLKAGSNILVLVPSYSISYDGTTFTYVLTAKLVDRTQSATGRISSVTRYQQVFEYVLPQSDLPNGVSWDRLSADQWKVILTQGAAETVAMLNYDITAQPSDTQPKFDYGRMRVLLDQNKGERSWVRTNFALLSVASASLKARRS